MVAQGENKILEGHIILRKPTFDERYEALEKSGFEDVIDSEKTNNFGGSKFKAIRLMVQESKKLYVSVDLKVIETGEEIKSFEQMQLSPECDSVLMEVASKLGSGFGVGKR